MSEPILILALFVLLGFLFFGTYFLNIWRKDRLRQFEADEENRKRQLAIARTESEERRLEAHRQRQYQEELLEQQKERWRDEEYLRREEQDRQERIAMEQAAGTGSGGYIILDLPDDKRSLFHDLLKGFEDYALIKGYGVKFSIDSTYPHRIAFKFTLANDVINVSPEMVKADFREYIDKVQNGHPLDDLPVIISAEDHDLLLTTLKNRINFLQHSHNLQKNAVGFYESLLSRFSDSRLLTAPNVVVQTGGLMDSRNYNAENSSRLIQGDSNDYADSSLDTSIKIGNSFNERKSQLEGLEKLLEILKADSHLDPTHKENAVSNLEKVKDEVADENEPDKSRIAKWLGKAKDSLQLLQLGASGLEAISQVYKSFGLPEISSLIRP